MFGSLGVSVLGLALTLILFLTIGRFWRSRRSPQLPEVLRSGLLPVKKFRPAFKHNLMQIEEALPFLVSKKIGANKLPAMESLRLTPGLDLQARLEQMEFECAQLMERNAELSRALAHAEQLRQDMCEIASAAMRSAGLTITADPYVPLGAQGLEQPLAAPRDEAEMRYSALKAKECSQTS